MENFVPLINIWYTRYMNAKEVFKELRLLIRDIGVLLSALPVEAGEFEEIEEEKVNNNTKVAEEDA